jgi:predicted RecA/RadA family phage recombinase
MKNYVKPGYKVTRAHASAVESGDAVVVGTQLVVACGKYAADEEGEYLRAGVVSVPKKAALAIAQGAKVWWDESASEITTVEADGDVVAGTCDKAALAADTEVEVLLNNIPYAFN